MRLFGRVGQARVAGPGAARDGGRGGGAGAGIAQRGGVVLVYVSARSSGPVWSVVGRAVWRRSLPSSAAAARTSQMSVRISCISWSVVGRGYASSELGPTRRRILWMAWYPQVRGCFGLAGGPCRVSGPASICVWAAGMAQIQGTVPVDGQRGLIHWSGRAWPVPCGSPPALR